jgi:release factor glutamine methyltransferase
VSAPGAVGTLSAYLSGRQMFMGLELLAAPGVLVPRPETELLGWTARRLLDQLAADVPDGRPLRVIDMCCGSGNLACALAAGAPRARVWACDVTAPCVDLACRNVERLELGTRVSVHRGDLFAPLGTEGLAGAVDMIVCNPPYISTERLRKDRAELLDQEPREAFDGGPYGISIQLRVVNEARAYLRSGGWLLLEIGLGQDRQMAQLLGRAKDYAKAESVVNQDGDIRVVMSRKL